MACSSNHEPCLASRCCTAEPAFTCQKRLGKSFAQCRAAASADGVMWFQQGKWELVFDACSADHQDCFESRCCRNDGFGCYRRGTRRFAQCKAYDAATCQDTDEWKCPGWEAREHLGKASGVETVAEYLARVGSLESECTPNYDNCMGTHCCKGAGFRCFEKKSQYYAQCLPPIKCQPSDEFVCNDITGTAISSPPPPMPPRTPPALASSATAAALLLSVLLLCSLALAALVMRRRAARCVSDGARAAASELELAEAGAARTKGNGGLRADKKGTKRGGNASSDEVMSLAGAPPVTTGGGTKKGKAVVGTAKTSGGTKGASKGGTGSVAVGKKAAKGKKSRATAEEAAALNVDEDL